MLYKLIKCKKEMHWLVGGSLKPNGQRRRTSGRASNLARSPVTPKIMYSS
jgi:hypothetical protein